MGAKHFIYFLLIIFPCILSQSYYTRGVKGYSTKIRKRKIFVQKPHLCALNFKDSRDYVTHDLNMEMIYFITPTYLRPEQMPQLIRLSHTLMHVPRIHWIVADDSDNCSQHVMYILRRSGLPYTHISSPKPNFKRGPRPLRWGSIPRGVPNRKAGLEWLQQTVKNGILYFGDDDNTYDLDLFDEIRKTKKVSMFPVGLIGFYGASAPVMKDGKLVGFFDSWYAHRKFPVDMAGFAVNIKHLTTYANMPYKAGFLEDMFLRSLGLKMEDIEIMGNNCSKILVWHTKNEKRRPVKLKVDTKQLTKAKYYNLNRLLSDLSEMGVVKLGSEGIRAGIILNSGLERFKISYLSDLSTFVSV